MLLPAVAWVVAFTFFPLISVVHFSFANYVLGSGITGYVGFANYAAVLDLAAFWHGMAITAIYDAVAVPIELVLGFVLAWLVSLGAPGSESLPRHPRGAAVHHGGRDRLSGRHALYFAGRPDHDGARRSSASTFPGSPPAGAGCSAPSSWISGAGRRSCSSSHWRRLARSPTRSTTPPSWMRRATGR